MEQSDKYSPFYHTMGFSIVKEETMEQPNKYSPFFNTMGYASSDFLKVAIKRTLEQSIADGEGKDGTALDMVIGACFADGETFTDGECLDIITYIVQAWDEIGDEEEAS